MPLELATTTSGVPRNLRAFEPTPCRRAKPACRSSKLWLVVGWASGGVIDVDPPDVAAGVRGDDAIDIPVEGWCPPAPRRRRSRTRHAVACEPVASSRGPDLRARHGIQDHHATTHRRRCRHHGRVVRNRVVAQAEDHHGVSQAANPPTLSSDQVWPSSEKSVSELLRFQSSDGATGLLTSSA